MFLPLIFLDKVKVVPSNNYGPHHLGTLASSRNNTTSDRNIASEWALLVNICSCKQWRATSFFKCDFEEKIDDSLMTSSVLQRHVPLAKGDLRCQVHSFHCLGHETPNSIYNCHTYNELKSYVTNAYWAQFEFYIL